MGWRTDNSIPRVTSRCAIPDPPAAVPLVSSAVRRSHRVSSQISPSRCTSGNPKDLPEVSVGESARTGPDAAGATTTGAHPRRAVHRLGAQQAVERELTHHEVAVLDLVIRLVPALVEEIQRVPVAPGFTHGAGLLVVQTAVAVGVGHQTVGQTVPVFVVHDLGVVATVRRRDRSEPESGQFAEQVHLHRWWDAVGRGRHVGVVDVVQVGEPVIGVGPVRRVGQHHVGAAGSAELEVAGRIVEPDRRRLQVVVEVVEEEEDLRRVVAQLRLPALLLRQVPGADPFVAAVLAAGRRVDEPVHVEVELEPGAGRAAGRLDRVVDVREAVVEHVLEHPRIRSEQLGPVEPGRERVHVEDRTQVDVVGRHPAAVGRDAAVVEGPDVVARRGGRGRRRARVREVGAVEHLPSDGVDQRKIDLAGAHGGERLPRQPGAPACREQRQLGGIAPVGAGRRDPAGPGRADGGAGIQSSGVARSAKSSHRATGDVHQPAARGHGRVHALAEHGEASGALHPREVMRAVDVHVVTSQPERPQVRGAKAERGAVRSHVAERDRGGRTRARSREEPVQATHEPQRTSDGVTLDRSEGAQRTCQGSPGCHGPRGNADGASRVTNVERPLLPRHFRAIDGACLPLRTIDGARLPATRRACRHCGREQ